MPSTVQVSDMQSLCPILICPHEAGGPAEVELSRLKDAIKSNSKMVIDTTGKMKINLNKWKMIEPQLPYIIGIQESKGW